MFLWKADSQTINLKGKPFSLNFNKEIPVTDEELNNDDYLRGCFLKGYIVKVSVNESGRKEHLVSPMIYNGEDQ